MLKDMLDLLRELQGILNQKFEIEQKIEELPREIERRNEVVIRMKENFLEFNDKRNTLRKEVIVKRDELERLQESTLKLEKEVGKVSSQKDYEQIERVIKDNSEKEQLIRRELQISEKKISELQEEFTNSETLLQDQEKALNEIKIKMEQDLVKLGAKRKELEAKEAGLTRFMDDSLVFKFERILKSRTGDGIVPIRKNVCYGCHILLPLKIVNDVSEGKKIITCPYCSKILFYDGEYDDDEVENIEIAGLRDIIDDEEIVLDDFDDDDYHALLNEDEVGSDDYSPAKNLEEIGNDEDEDESDMADEIDVEHEDNSVLTDELDEELDDE